MEFLLRRNCRSSLRKALLQQNWLVLHDSYTDASENFGIHCGLLAATAVRKALLDPDWDLGPGDGQPRVGTWFAGDRESREHHRFGTEAGTEPLVFWRTFHGLREPHVELSGSRTV